MVGVLHRDRQVQTKLVFLVRHAQAEHNVAEEWAEDTVRAHGGSPEEQEAARRAVLDDPALRDPGLTERGEQQASVASSSLADMVESMGYNAPDVVLVSPLRRTLQTARLLFPEHPRLEALELLREKRTGKPCDERTNASCVAKEFPQVCFDAISQQDASSDRGYVFHPDDVEDNHTLRRRSHLLLELLGRRPERVLALITHKGLLRELNRVALSRPDDSCEGEDSTHDTRDPTFGNAEMRVIEIEYDARVEAPPLIRFRIPHHSPDSGSSSAKESSGEEEPDETCSV